MMLKINVNRRLLRMLRREFKNDLAYFTNSGMVYWFRQNLGWLEYAKHLEQNDELSCAFQKELAHDAKTSSLTLSSIQNDDIHFLKMVSNLICDDRSEKFNPSKTFNWLMFYMLANSGCVGINLENFADHHSLMDSDGVMNLYGGDALDNYANEPHKYLE